MKITYRSLDGTGDYPLWACGRCGGAVADRDAHAGWHRSNEGRGPGDAGARSGPSYTTEQPATWEVDGADPVGREGHGGVLSEGEAESMGLLLNPEDYAAQEYRSGFGDGDRARRQAFLAGLPPDTLLDVSLDLEMPRPVTVDDVARYVERGLVREAARREVPEIVVMDGSRPFPVPVHAVPKYGDVVDTYMQGVRQALDDGEEQLPE
jgi:hypothetical protein